MLRLNFLHSLRAARPLQQWLASTGLLLAAACATLSAAGAAAQYDDPPEVLPAEQSLTEAQRDHAEATALYTHGRVLLQRGSQLSGKEQTAVFREALRCFQRAWLFDNQLVLIMEDIAPLAYMLEHRSEATRYRALAAEQQSVPAELVLRAALVLSEQEQYERALRLYRKLAADEQNPADALTQFEIGRLSLLVGNFDDAAQSFLAVREALDNPTDPSLTEQDRARLLRQPEVIYALFGEAFLRAKRLDEAEAMFRRADSAKPNAPMLQLRLAQVNRLRGAKDDALQQLSEYFAAKTTSAGMLPYLLLADLLDEQGEPGTETGVQVDVRPPSPELLARLQQLADADPNNAFLGYFLADRLRAADRLDQAISQYQKMLALESAADGHQGLIEIFAKQRAAEPLLLQLAAVVGETGSLSPIEVQLALLKTDIPLRDELCRLADERLADPAQPAARGIAMAMALIEAELGDFARAERFWNAALQPPGPAAGIFTVNYGISLLQRNEAARAADAFQRVLTDKLLPERESQLYFYLSGACTLAKEYDRALQAAREAARLEPNSVRMAAREAWVLYQAKRLDEAEQAYRRVLERFDHDFSSDEERESLRDLRMILSAMHVEQGRIADAEERLLQVLDEFPEDLGAFNDLGYLWCDEGRHLERSLRMIEKAVAAEPDNTAYRDSLGWALFRLGQFDRAVAELQRAASSESVDGVILEHLGDAQAEANQLPAALESWQKAATHYEQQNDTTRLKKVQEKIKSRSAP
jgi:tetratricopeptide (TPR) repeat protein